MNSISIVFGKTKIYKKRKAILSQRQRPNFMDNSNQNETTLTNTPYLEINLEKVREAYGNIFKYLPGIEIFYAMKCNPNLEIMKLVIGLGSQFEISSAAELKKAMQIGADPKKILFSNPIKTLNDIKFAFFSGVNYFAFDSYSEIKKLAEGAPGSNVYVRLAIPVKKSAVASEGKFGVSIEMAKKLMIHAKASGLNPYGISFHVGSQMLDHKSWERAIFHSSKLIKLLKKDGIDVKFLDIGGGFPVKYSNVKRDNLDKIGETIIKALKKYIPGKIRVVCEPGRYLVANSGIMVSTIIGTAERRNKKWLHLDVGADNGLMESLQTANTLAFPVRDSRGSNNKDIFILTGPTCDSQDTILFNVPVSSNIEIGDKIYFECAGAYTTAFTENFNGFSNPKTLIIDKQESST